MNKIKYMICALACFAMVTAYGQVVMTDGTTLTEGTDWSDGDTFLDPGGTSCYPLSADVTTTLCPSTGGDPVSITFTALDIETRSSFGTAGNECWDFLTISDADGVLFTGCGEDGPDVFTADACSDTPDGGDGDGTDGGAYDLNAGDSFTSTSADGCLTINFNSDSSVDEHGWISTINSASTVTPAGVPTMGQWGLIILGLMLLIAGTVFVMKTKETVVEA